MNLDAIRALLRILIFTSIAVREKPIPRVKPKHPVRNVLLLLALLILTGLGVLYGIGYLINRAL